MKKKDFVDWQIRSDEHLEHWCPFPGDATYGGVYANFRSLDPSGRPSLWGGGHKLSKVKADSLLTAVPKLVHDLDQMAGKTPEDLIREGFPVKDSDGNPIVIGDGGDDDSKPDDESDKPDADKVPEMATRIMVIAVCGLLVVLSGLVTFVAVLLSDGSLLAASVLSSLVMLVALLLWGLFALVSNSHK